MNGVEQTLNDGIEAFFKMLFSFLFRCFKGVKQLNKIPKILGFLCTFLIPWATIRYKPVLNNFMDGLEMPIWFRWIIYILLYAMPLWYLAMLQLWEDRKQNIYIGYFKEMGFHGKDGKHPYFLKKHDEDGKTIYDFKSNIPLSEWRKVEERIETVFDCTIVGLENTTSKRLVKMETVKSDRRIPKMVRWEDSFLSEEEAAIRIGQGAIQQIEFNLDDTPHAIIAGETGSGKSVILRLCLWEAICKGYKIYMMDFKGGVEFGKRYEQFGEVMTSKTRVLEVLEDICNEMEKRLELFRDLEIKKLSEYNKRTGQNLCRIALFCDEIAEMLDKRGMAKEEKNLCEQIEAKLSSIARLGRAPGINLFLGMQRPDSNVLTGQIKNNIPVRVSGRFADKAASEIVLGNTEAVKIPNIKGRFLIKLGNEMTEFQAYLFDDDTMLRDDIDVKPGSLLIHQNNRLKNEYYDRPDPSPGKVETQKDERREEKTLDLDLDY